TAFELGYRVQPLETVALDMTAFYNDYDDIRTLEPGLPALSLRGGIPHLLFPLNGDNNASADSYGFEMATTWEVTPNWNIMGSYSLIALDMDVDAGSGDTLAFNTENNTPQHQFNIRSQFDLTEDIKFDNALFYYDNIAGIDSYMRFDTRIA